jgi:RNA polymerase sigma-70 factor (ECF subfamily)
MTTPSDDDLMLRYAQGDAAAFDELYARHEGAMFRFVRRVLGTDLAAQADEVFQDSWLKIINARQNYQAGAASWKTWAYAIAQNCAIDRLRKSGREVGMPDVAGEDDATDWIEARAGMTQPSAEDTAFWRKAGQQLLHCLDELPPEQRSVFLLHHEEGTSLDDMVELLGVGFEAVKSRLRYAMKKLRGCMGEHLVWEAA